MTAKPRRSPVIAAPGTLAALAALTTLSTVSPAALAAPVSGRGNWETTLQARDINRDGDVRVVPEPSAPALLGLALSALLVLRMTRPHAVQATTNR